MAFFFQAIVVMYVGRKVGWALSRAVLYPAPLVVSGVASAIWGVAVAFVMFSLIQSHSPNLVLKIVMGYALGWYVAIPNYGLFLRAFLPDEAQKHHSIISTLPPVAYLIGMVLFTLTARS